MATFDRYRKNVFSQNGEDGVLEELLSRLSIQQGVFVEFGAWDGKHLSNTYNLLQKGWGGIYIEGDPVKYRDLVSNMVPFGNRVATINALVQPAGPSSLDALLRGTNIGKDFELLSIDIDSFDWHVWAGFKNYRPKIVVIEIDSKIPVGIVQTYRNDKINGSSFTATLELGKKKGYTLVCHCGNQIFVRDDLAGNARLTPEELEFPELLFDYGWVQK